MTMKEMCEKIVKADFLKMKDDRPATAREIFEHSSNGELFQIYGWYDQARLVLDEITEAELELEYLKGLDASRFIDRGFHEEPK